MSCNLFDYSLAVKTTVITDTSNSNVTNVRPPVPNVGVLATIKLNEVRKRGRVSFICKKVKLCDRPATPHKPPIMSTLFLRMESASPEHRSEQPPGHIANLVGIVIAMMTITLPLYAISNFNTAAEATVRQPQSPLFVREPD